MCCPGPTSIFPAKSAAPISTPTPRNSQSLCRHPKARPTSFSILIDDAVLASSAPSAEASRRPRWTASPPKAFATTCFHTTALCSPTRAALITGRNHHSAAFAGITEIATGYDGYTCILPKSCGTVGEVLRQNGYMTAWIGKNHNTPTWETSAAGPFDRWANGLGFDYFYGFNAGDMNHWDPILYENRNLVPRSKDPNYHLTTDIADKSIAWVRQATSISPEPSLLPLRRSRSHPRPTPHAERMDR